MPRMKLHRKGLYDGNLQVNLNNGPLRCSDLETIRQLLNYYQLHYRRTGIAHLTLDTDKNYFQRGGTITNDPIVYFAEHFMAYMNSLPLERALDMSYIRKTEMSEDGVFHWHIFLVYNYDAMMSIADPHLDKAHEIFSKAIGLSNVNYGLIERKKSWDLYDGMHGKDYNRHNHFDHFNSAFNWMSYISKCDRSGELQGVKRLFQSSQFPRGYKGW